MRNFKEKTCIVCGKTYKPNSGRAKVCQECREAFNYNRINNWKQNNKQHLAKYFRDYLKDEEHHQKHLQRLKTNSRIKSGKLQRAEKCAVKGCKCTENLQMHHICYQGDFAQSAVVTLCKKHHAQHHKELRQRERKANQIKISIKIG